MIKALAALAMTASLVPAAAGQPAGGSELMDMLRGEPLVLSSLFSGQEPVILIGEIHTDSALRRAIAGELKAAKDAGFSWLALEYPEDAAEVFKRFNAGEPAAALAAELRSYYDPIYHPDSVAELLAAARDAGLAVRPVDLPERESDALRPASIFGDEASWMEARNRRMSERIAELASSGGRVLFWGGLDHSRKNAIPRILAESYGMKTRTFASFAGIEPISLDLSSRKGSWQASVALWRVLNPRNEIRLLRPQSAEPGVDGIVLLPLDARDLAARELALQNALRRAGLEPPRTKELFSLRLLAEGRQSFDGAK